MEISFGINMKEFKKDELEFFLPDNFKGLSKNYLLECIFDNEIQSKWKPNVGDIIVGITGNVFVISCIDNLHESLGGKRYYFGGGGCNRDGGNVLNSTFCYTANESGKYIHPIEGEQDNLYHSSIRNFRYVPYPHERNFNNEIKIPAKFIRCDNDFVYMNCMVDIDNKIIIEKKFPKNIFENTNNIDIDTSIIILIKESIQ